jgi:hypothetical protein
MRLPHCHTFNSDNQTQLALRSLINEQRGKWTLGGGVTLQRCVSCRYDACLLPNGATRAHEVRTLQRTYFMTDVAEVTTRHEWIWRGIAGERMQLAICCHEKTWRHWDIHGKTQTTAKTTKRWSTVKDETAVIQEDNRIRQVTNVKLAPVRPAPFEGTQSCDVTQEGSTCVLA